LRPAASRPFVRLVAGLDRRGIGAVVCALHSLAGVLAHGLSARLGSRLESCVFVSAVIPPPGGAVIDTLGGVQRLIFRTLFTFRTQGSETVSRDDPAHPVRGSRRIRRRVGGVQISSGDARTLPGIRRRRAGARQVFVREALEGSEYYADPAGHDDWSPRVLSRARNRFGTFGNVVCACSSGGSLPAGSGAGLGGPSRPSSTRRLRAQTSSKMPMVRCCSSAAPGRTRTRIPSAAAKLGCVAPNLQLQRRVTRHFA